MNFGTTFAGEILSGTTSRRLGQRSHEPLKPGGGADGPGGVDEPDAAEGPREIPQQVVAVGGDFLGEQPQIRGVSGGADTLVTHSGPELH